MIAKIHTFVLTFSLCVLSCKTNQNISNYASNNLIINKISNHAFQHISYLNTQSFGKVECNGLIVFDKNEVIIFDTPADDKSSSELINWVENQLKCTVKAIIPTHFHEDCLGGLAEFHRRNIPSFANILTIQFAKENNYVVPQNGIEKYKELTVGNKNIICEFVGEGHTKDNIIGYFPSENIMFGGCLIKTMNATKGNLADANVTDWAETVRKVKAKYPNVKTVVPGHGKIGGQEILDYTIQLFSENK